MINHKLKQLAALISASLATDASYAIVEDLESNTAYKDTTISVTPLNTSVSKYLAAHRSHSSHGSHGSHRSSSSGGGYSAPSPPQKSAAPPPPPSPPPSPPSQQKKADPLGQPPRPPSSYPPNTTKDLSSTLKDAEKRKNIIMRMQLTLQFEGLYGGAIDGVMGPKTREAIMAYKKKKGIQGESVLDAQTLNAFGIPGF